MLSQGRIHKIFIDVLQRFWILSPILNNMALVRNCITNSFYLLPFFASEQEVAGIEDNLVQLLLPSAKTRIYISEKKLHKSMKIFGFNTMTEQL